MSAESGTRALSARELAEILNAEVLGDADCSIRSLEVIELAGPEHLTYIGDAKNLSRLRRSKCRVVIAPAELRNQLAGCSNRTFVLVDEPESAFLRIAAVLRPRRQRSSVGISERAAIDPSARIGPGTNIHPLAVIGCDVVIGDACEIHAGVVIGAGCRLGNNVTLHPNTVLYEDVQVGNDVIIHASCVIGADGFGYRFVNGRHERLEHYGIVRICDDVEIGAGTTIDRAKAGETVIGTGTRIDNLVMIGHNCRIGRHNLLVSQVGFAGSVTTGDYVVCAGQAGIADHVHLGDGAIIGAQAGVHRDMPGGQTYLGAPAAPVADTTRQLIALKRLPEIRDTVKKMEKELDALRLRLQQESRPSSNSADDAAAA